MSIDAVGDAMALIQQGASDARKNGKANSNWEQKANAGREISAAAHKTKADRAAKDGARDAKDAAEQMGGGDAGQVIQQVLSMVQQGAELAQMLGGGAQGAQAMGGMGALAGATPLASAAPMVSAMPAILPIFF